MTRYDNNSNALFNEYIFRNLIQLMQRRYLSRNKLLIQLTYTYIILI